MRTNRRLVAILAADIAGYSRLMGDDEEGTLRRVKAIQSELFNPEIELHHGRLVKTTGDGLLVEFSSVVDALRCASEVQVSMAAREPGEPLDRRIQFRMGIHQGDVVVEDGDIFGNGVNIAARLEGIADPGGICVSSRVHEDAVGRIDLDFEDMGEQALKNIARPIRSYRVRPNAVDAPAPVEAPAPESMPGGAAPVARRQPRARTQRSAYANLLAEPRRFRFDAAIRVLLHVAKSADPAEAMRFSAPPGFAYPSADITAIEPPAAGRPPLLITPVIGLTGATGVLPRLYTEVLTTSLRNRSRAFLNFLDVLAHRTIAMFARAGIKYRINRAAETTAGTRHQDPVAGVLLAFTGYATPNLVPRLAVGSEPLLHYSGFFAAHPRSAERLAGLVSDWLGRKVEVVQFVGAWLPLPPDQRSTLAVGRRPGKWNGLGVDASIGVRAWDPQARIILRIGPLDRAGFAALLPDRPGLQRLVSLVRAFLGFETGFAVNPVIAGPEVPPLLLDPSSDAPPRLGWNTWVPAGDSGIQGIQRPDADEAVFEAEIVEAEEFSNRERQ